MTLLVGDALGMPGEVATIEDLFPEVCYMEKVRESHKRKLKSKGIGTDAIKLNGSGPVLPRLHQCFDKLKVDFNKGSVGKLIRRDLIRCQSVDTLPPGMAKKGETLLTALRDAFGTSDEQTTYPATEAARAEYRVHERSEVVGYHRIAVQVLDHALAAPPLAILFSAPTHRSVQQSLIDMCLGVMPLSLRGVSRRDAFQHAANLGRIGSALLCPAAAFERLLFMRSSDGT